MCIHAFICFDTNRSRISEARNVGNDVINNNSNNFYKVLYPVIFTSSRRCHNNTQPLILSLMLMNLVQTTEQYIFLLLLVLSLSLSLSLSSSSSFFLFFFKQTAIANGLNFIRIFRKTEKI